MAKASLPLYNLPPVPSSETTLHRALPRLHLYYELVRLPKRHTASLLFFGFLAASFRSDSVLPSSDIDDSFARHGLRPRHVEYALTFNVHTDTGFRVMNPLALCNYV